LKEGIVPHCDESPGGGQVGPLGRTALSAEI
jgi:hypothetical protein